MSTKPKILLAEDDKFISRAYNDGLKRAGFKMLIATDGLKTMEIVKKDKPDLILLDLVMPDKDGFEVLKELKMDDELKKIPVIILSNLGQDSDVKKGKELGAIDYLIKANYSMKDVVAKVKEHSAKLKVASKK